MEQININCRRGSDLAACLAHVAGYALDYVMDGLGVELAGDRPLVHAMKFLYENQITAMPWCPQMEDVFSDESIRRHISLGGVAILNLNSYSDGWCIASDCLLHKPFNPEDLDDLEIELDNLQLENVVLIGEFLGEMW